MAVITRNQAAVDEAHAQTLAAARVEAIAQINAKVSIVRRRFVTDIPGQEALYLLKEQEARDWIAEVERDFPLIMAEVGITGDTPDQVAQVYLNLGAIYLQAAAVLEQVRLSKIAAIEAAQTSEDIEAVISDFPALIESFTSPWSNE